MSYTHWHVTSVYCHRDICISLYHLHILATGKVTMSVEDEEIIVPANLGSPGGLDEDDVVFSYIREPNEDAKFKAKLSSLYTNESLTT